MRTTAALSNRLLALALLLLLMSACHTMKRTTPRRAGYEHPFNALDPNPLRQALEKLGQSPHALTMGDAFLSNPEKWQLPAFTRAMQKPLEIPYALSHTRRALLEKPHVLHEALLVMEGKVGVRSIPMFSGHPRVKELKKKLLSVKTPLSTALLLMGTWDYNGLGEAYSKKRNQGRLLIDLKTMQTNAAKVPLPIQQAAALMLITAMENQPEIYKAFRNAEGLYDDRWIDALKKGTANCTREPDRTEDVVDATDFRHLYTAAQNIAGAVDLATAHLANFPTTATFSFQWETPLGWVVLQSDPTKAHQISAKKKYLLCMDMDGANDTYLTGGGATSPEHPISILIDWGGDDKYSALSPHQPAFGGACMGVGILVDRAGNDNYTAAHHAMGSGLLGVGILLDKSGDDQYAGTSHVQGTGAFGLGLLIDGNGNDKYQSYGRSQGLGYVRGCGFLMDLGDGSDRYTLKSDKLLFPSAQAPKTHNSSVGQGFGLGRRADVIDGHSWAGGYGLLMDEGGDDFYKAGVMAQGGGYWYGMGFLMDRGGDDSYSAHWYCQGSAAHMAVGALLDHDGNDRYHSTAHLALGAAHDLSASWLVDEQGNDTYDTTSLSMGVSNMNGLGIFLDVSGHDMYVSKKIARFSLGGARITKPGSRRETILNAGIFLDCGGNDTYQNFPPANNNSSWQNSPVGPELGLISQMAVGIDTETKGKSPIRLKPWTEKTK